jgi:hypothetical protein
MKIVETNNFSGRKRMKIVEINSLLRMKENTN